MATIPQAIEVLIKATGLPRAGVEYRARYLRNKGLLPKGKRGGGKSAAHLDANHLANLLVSLVASAEQTKAVEATKPLLKAKLAVVIGKENWPKRIINSLNSPFGSEDWLKWTFGKVVAKLIEMAKNDEGREVIDRYLVGLEASLVKEKPRVTLILKDRKQDKVKITTSKGGELKSGSFKIKPEKVWLHYGQKSKDVDDWDSEDLERSTQFEMKASIGRGIFASLAELLDGEEGPKTE
ncbi:MAG: hypothetical protein O2817_11470 [Proteobacteria bacterium]|nr:hypothetical protein [Pseudomonadota bacterium]